MNKKQEIKALQKHWYDKLKKDGFVDLENSKNVMKSFSIMNTKSKRFHDREAVLEFFLKLDAYVTHSKDLKPLHKAILTHHSEGLRLNQIAELVSKSVGRVRQIIQKHKQRVSTFVPL